MKKFDPLNIELKGSNLIEASAGTGKTYSITLLVVRMILEKSIDIRKILMVTFTKAAVAELDERIRIAVRNSYNYLRYHSDADESLKKIVDRAASNNRDFTIQLLKDSVLHLDELSVFTIHSFCQQMLTEFAFETGQLFGIEMLSDESEIIEQAANRYWRENIAVLPVELLSLLTKSGLNRTAFIQVIIDGVGPINWDSVEEYTPNNTLKEYQKQEQKAEQIKIAFDQTAILKNEDFLAKIANHKNAKNLLGNSLHDSSLFLKTIYEKYKKSKTQYLEKLFPEELNYANMYGEALESADKIVKECIYYIYGEAINYTKNEIVKIKHKQQLLSFNDLIQNLNQATKNSETLRNGIAEKFEAVFIDEFQDTDSEQYEIFNSVFGQKHPLFFIGDPKQSIYAWRGADLNTYKIAAQNTQNKYSMQVNYRSNQEFIEACNAFFSASEKAFLDDQIIYNNVSAPSDSPPLVYRDQEKSRPISVYTGSKKDEINEQTAIQIHHLLQFNYRIGNKKIIPSDITILVRSKLQGAEIKEALAKYNIPAVNKDESKILKSNETQAVYYLLKAMLEPNRSNINRALLGPFTPLTVEQIQRLQLEREISQFQELNLIWDENGIYQALYSFINRYEVRSYLFDELTSYGERILSNLFQIIELLHQTEYRKKLNSEELVQWLRKNMNSSNSDDAFLQRIESDKSSVNITTIHSSKGLAYPIVFAPNLNFNKRHPKGNSVKFKKANESGYTFSLRYSEEELNQSYLENEQENRRLIYVAITRAINKCFIGNSTQNKNNFLSQNLEKLQGNELFDFSEPLEPLKDLYQLEKSKVSKTQPSFSGSIYQNWGVFSFSKLNSYQAHPIVESDFGENNEYNQFIFKGMGKGPVIGNFLHDLLEAADFSNEESWTYHVQRNLKQNAIIDPSYENQLIELIGHVSLAKLSINKGFQLKDIQPTKKLPELEFFFKIDQAKKKEIETLFPEVKIDLNLPLNGVMTGFIDLLFEHKGQFYILDWKSNYLGSSIEHYKHEKLDEAMTDHNYHLQYLIYTVAVHRYLKTKISEYNYHDHFGGVLYLFLRGLRNNVDHGVFSTKPSFNLIEKLDQIL